ncbi:MAG: MarR family transcriptional regulator [Bacteroidetes bacterium]|nr:MarR family transcriptional regulator [Bacteroidota bacterium]MDA1344699.1 MarR family transcriptional regulator [Bacteroidota bacterium]
MAQKTLDYALRAAWMAVSKMYNREALKFDSTMATGFALLNIDPQGTPSTALGPKMGMENTSLSRLLKSMEDRQLIIRKPDPNDGRGVLIFLTHFGKEKRDTSREIVLRFNDQITQSLSATQIKHFFDVSEIIIQQSLTFEHLTPNPINK